MQESENTFEYAGKPSLMLRFFACFSNKGRLRLRTKTDSNAVTAYMFKMDKKIEFDLMQEGSEVLTLLEWGVITCIERNQIQFMKMDIKNSNEDEIWGVLGRGIFKPCRVKYFNHLPSRIRRTIEALIVEDLSFDYTKNIHFLKKTYERLSAED